MKYKEFKKHIDRIKSTGEKEEELAQCIEKVLSTTTYCIVDLASEITVSVIELLADYYDCYFEIQGVKDNEISCWLYEDSKTVYIRENGVEKEIDLSSLKKFWRYLEDNKMKKEQVNKK